MSIGKQFNEWRAMVSQVAARGLAEPLAGSPLLREGVPASAGLSLEGLTRESLTSVMVARPAARLLLGDDPAQHAGLVAAMRALADLGRPWLNIGVNVGTLSAQTDIQQAHAARAAIDALLRRHDEDEVRVSPPPLPRAGQARFPVALCDAAGHMRDIYHPLAVHLCLAAFHRRYESIHPSLWSAGEQAILEMVAPLRLVEHFTDACPPAGLVPLVLWQALGLAEQAMILSRDIDLEMVDSAVQAIAAGGPPDGTLHHMTEHDTLDTWTYGELTGLHALAALALKRRNGAWAQRVEQVAQMHLEHTQPDNVTNQPWGVFAFVWPVKTQSFAEQQLHDATAHAGGTVDPLAAMLLADAADCLAEFG